MIRIDAQLLPCPFCGGAAELGRSDMDGTVIMLKVSHDEDCPACMFDYEPTWRRLFFPENFDLSKGSVEDQVAAWWNRRTASGDDFSRAVHDGKL